MGTAGGGSGTEGVGIRGFGGEQGAVIFRRGEQGFRAVSGEWQQQVFAAGSGRSGFAGTRLSGRGFENDVGVGAAEAEGIDAGEKGSVLRVKFFELLDDAQFQL